MKRRFVNISILIAIALLFIMPLSLLGQSQWHYPHKEDLTSVIYTPIRKHDGFAITISLVAMFTSGVSDRNGFRLGMGFNVSQTIDNWTVTSGLDIYKEKQRLGLGMSYAGVSFDDTTYGGSYYLTKYWQTGKQMSGILGLHIDKVRIRFEDDILALPFTGFIMYDRYRTAALELNYDGVLVGTNVYTNEPNGLLAESATNQQGVFANSEQISSPIYVGYSNRNIVLRYGLNSKLGGYAGQNAWHEYLFLTPNFKSGGQNHHFMQLGADKPYTMY